MDVIYEMPDVIDRFEDNAMPEEKECSDSRHVGPNPLEIWAFAMNGGGLRSRCVMCDRRYRQEKRGTRL